MCGGRERGAAEARASGGGEPEHALGPASVIHAALKVEREKEKGGVRKCGGRERGAAGARASGGEEPEHALGPNDNGAGNTGLGQRQRAVVLGEDGALAHAVARELQRVVVAHALGADAVERRRRVEEAHADAHFEQAREHRVDVRHLDVAAVERLLRVGRHEAAAVDVGAGGEDHGDRLLGRLRVVVRVEDVAVGVAVARHVCARKGEGGATVADAHTRASHVALEEEEVG